ncbi:Down syndrome cell adhesion molecule homolog [Sinocyclocheilus grahami]|uniref:Down syndrome cell adhesion molecule homolog n=1 Tax=Sinocyclocheilus grahami TaxID=75366 RepID=UPI0007AD6A4B|nr:PREDICTED: Down syndrome cell adhesion molecule homolog [Sinocyclocheilus grahami]
MFFFCLNLWSLSGVFGVESVKSVSVTEGESVSLNSDLTEIQRDDEITWKFEDIMIAKIYGKDNKSRFYDEYTDGRFRDRLKLDHQTGSLSITNTRTTDSGVYKVTSKSSGTPLNIFSLTVYAHLPVPVITRDSSQNSSSSSSSSSYCSLLCSVVNVGHVTLSWYKGNSIFSSISVSDLNRSLSLHLECLDDSYSCVVNNPISNQTQHLNNTELCQPCSGVFGAESVKSVSVTEGESVSLNSDLTEIQRDDEIMWKFENIMIAKIYGKDNKSKFHEDNADGRFRDRLKLDHQTGSLSITNTRTTDSGLYKVTSKSSGTPLNIFSLTVYANLPVPDIIRNCSSSSSSSQQNCSLLCSVVNVSHVTLSWYKGNSLLSSISVSDLSISLSLPLEVEYQEKNTYSCVLNNPISNQTTHLNISELCLPCPDVIVLVSAAAAAGSLLIVAAVGIFCICRKHRKTDKEVQTRDREITYADPTFYKRHKSVSSATEQDNVVYAGVSRR